MQAAADRVTARLTLVGADPHDDDDLRARKALLVLISVLILPVAAVWGALYLAFGSPVGVVPLVYFGVLLGAIAVFSRARLPLAAPRGPDRHPEDLAERPRRFFGAPEQVREPRSQAAPAGDPPVEGQS
jgi:hypothetical protein